MTEGEEGSVGNQRLPNGFQAANSGRKAAAVLYIPFLTTEEQGFDA